MFMSGDNTFHFAKAEAIGLCSRRIAAPRPSLNNKKLNSIYVGESLQ